MLIRCRAADAARCCYGCFFATLPIRALPRTLATICYRYALPLAIFDISRYFFQPRWRYDISPRFTLDLLLTDVITPPLHAVVAMPPLRRAMLRRYDACFAMLIRYARVARKMRGRERCAVATELRADALKI